MVACSISLLAALAATASAHFGSGNPDTATSGSHPATQDCQKVRSDCQSKPDANQSFCASLYFQCSGTTDGLNKGDEPVAIQPLVQGYETHSAPQDCQKVRSDCQSKPDANQAFCASLYVQCSGSTDGLDKGDEPVVIPPPVQGYETHPAPQDCEKVRSDCQSKPDANQSFCGSLFDKCSAATNGSKPPVVETTVYTTICPATVYSTSGTQTYTSVYTTTSTITKCPGGCPSVTPTPTPGNTCQEKFNKCRNGEDGGDQNMSKCAADFAACNAACTAGSATPTQSNGPVPTPSPSNQCQDKYNKCRNGEDGGDQNMSKCAADFDACNAACTAGSATPTQSNGPVPTPSPSNQCQDKYNKCRNGEDGGDQNMSKCAADFASCDAGCPGGCSTPVQSDSPVPSNPADQCQDKFNKCRNGEDGGDQNMSKCAADFDACKNTTKPTYAPTTSGPPGTNNTGVAFTAAASSLQVGSVGLTGVVALAFFL